MRRSPSTFFDRAEAAASNRPEAQIIVPDLFDDTTILPQRHAFCSPAIVLSFHTSSSKRNTDCKKCSINIA
jgi:hypothetical protein